MMKNDLMREAAIRSYVADPLRWMQYRKKRNITSHVYDENMAQDVYETALAFSSDAMQLLKKLREKNL